MFVCGSTRFSTWTVQCHHPWSGCCHLCHHHAVSKLLAAAHLLRKRTHKTHNPQIYFRREFIFLVVAHTSQKWMRGQDGIDKTKKINVEKSRAERGSIVNLPFEIQYANSAVTPLESWREIKLQIDFGVCGAFNNYNTMSPLKID